MNKTNKKLTEQQCAPCRGDEPQATQEEREQWQKQIPQWNIVTQGAIDKLERVFVFADYTSAVAFANRIAELAEQLDHHPAILLEWGRVSVQWWTHKIGGLHRNDFIAAARTDALEKTK